MRLALIPAALLIAASPALAQDYSNSGSLSYGQVLIEE